MSVRSTSPIMRSSPVQVIPMEEHNNQNPKPGQFTSGSPRAWTPNGTRQEGKS